MAKKRFRVTNPIRFIFTSLLVAVIMAAIVFGVVALFKVLTREEPGPEISYSDSENESESGSWTDDPHGNVALGSLDKQLENIIQAFMEKQEESEAQDSKNYKYTLVILPGHGGDDPGNVAGQTPEKVINLAVSLYIKHYIESVTDDIRVVMSRETDVYVSYTDQRKLADDTDPDFLLAIHCNSFNGVAAGTEVEWMDNDSKTIRTRSQTAAKQLASVTASALSTKNRGDSFVTAGDGTILMKGFDAPAVIVELGFTSDASDDEKLNNTEYQMKIGDAIGAKMIQILYSYTPRNPVEE